MSTHWHLFKMGLQNTAAYRTNFFCRALFSLVPLISAMAIWRAVFAGKQTIAGYTLADMLSYYLVVTVVEITTAVTEDEWQVANDIKDGVISQFLIRPLDYLGYRLTLFAANRVVYGVAALLPIAAIIAWNTKYLSFPASITLAIAFLCSLVLAATIQFLLAYLTSMLAFWVLEISTFSFMLLAAQRIASGEMFPLDLLPTWLARLLMLTPFPYCMFFPANLYLGRVTGGGIGQGLAIQVLWILILFTLARVLWHCGLRSYTSVGG